MFSYCMDSISVSRRQVASRAIMTPPQQGLEIGEAAAPESPETNHLVPPIEPYPWRLYSHGQKQSFMTVTPNSSSSSSSSGYKIHERSIPALRNKKVMVCCHGWFLLSDQETSHNYSLWNPSTLQTIVLPPLELSRSFVLGWCILSSPPDTTNSTVLLLERCKPNIVFLRIGQGHEQWIERQCGRVCTGEESTVDFMSFPVCCNEQVYVTACYSLGRYLMKVDIIDDEEDTNKIIITPLVRLPCPRINASCHAIYYVESLGQLHLIYSIHDRLSSGCIDVEVYKLDLGEKRWEKVGSIQDQVFFLGIPNSVSCSALSELDRGHIYFPHGWYNIEVKSLSVASSDAKVSPLSSAIWVMPNYHRCRTHDNHQANGTDEVATEEEEAKKTSDFEDSKETTLLDLPQCIIGEISRHLTFLDYMNFRAVNRIFSIEAPVTEWRKTLALEENCVVYPWLMLCGQGRNEYTFIDPKFGGRYFMLIPQELVGATIHCAKDGWLLMSRDEDSTFFFNPFTKAILPCPPLSLGRQAISYHMSSAPTNSNYFVMAIDLEEDGVDIHHIHNGDEEWECNKLETGPNFKPNHNSPAPWVDEYYFLGCEGNLFRIVPRAREICNYYEVVPEPQAPCDSFHQNFLVECDEEMYSIFVGEHGKWVRVFFYDSSDDEPIRMIWREVETIGNWTMFLSRSSCLSVEVESEYEEMVDRIYFPRLHKGSLVFYSLKTGKFHSNNGKETLMDYAGTTELLSGCWTESKIELRS